ncbi:MAG: Glu/Leu/Phe/Val dehydrogenase dimerization domain-containing protein [Acidimicrobiales bacterium]
MTFTDEVTGHKGYLVIDRLVRGVSSGGLRVRSGCTLHEVRRLARAMTYKEALNFDPSARYVPLGGAKGGIDFEPRDAEARGVLKRYLQAMRPYLERFWTAGEDLGLSQSLLDEVVREVGLTSSVQAIYPLLDDREAATGRLSKAFAASSRGVSLDSLVGGFGVATAALAALEVHDIEAKGARAFIQGFGSMGGATARYLADAGVRVVGISDVRGVVFNRSGLDVESLLLSRDAFGGMDRSVLRGDDLELDACEWLSVDADVLVPAATSDCIDIDNQSGVRARLIVEAANLPVTPEAEAALVERGVVVIPDIVANSATNSWWWWTLFGDIAPSVEASLDKIDERMRALVTEMLSRAADRGCTPRQAALDLALEQVSALAARYGGER